MFTYQVLSREPFRYTPQQIGKMTMRQINCIMSAEVSKDTGAIISTGWGRPPRSKREQFELSCRRNGIFDQKEIDRLWKTDGQVTRHAPTL